MTNTSKATQIKAVERILSLRKNGTTLVDAKTIVSDEFNVSVYKLTQWFKIHRPNVTAKTNNIVVSRRSTPPKGLNDLCDTLFNTIEGLREGTITHKEASAMSSLAGNVTNIKKLQFAAHKYVSKASSQSMTVDKLLGQ
jgi:hypothetical protein